MFFEVDEALRALVRAEVLNGSDVEVVFDAPTKDWAARRNAPTVNLYLYDIREDLRRRERGMVNVYDDHGMVIERRQPPRHFKVTYLITAWTQRPEDEHRLLSALLYCFLRNEALPTELLRGQLAEIGLPVTMSVALPPPEDRSFADVWSALGGELKPSLDLVVTAPIDGGRAFTAGPPVREWLTIAVPGSNGAGETVGGARPGLEEAGAAAEGDEAEGAEGGTARGSGRAGKGGRGRTGRAAKSAGADAGTGEAAEGGGGTAARAGGRGAGGRPGAAGGAGAARVVQTPRAAKLHLAPSPARGRPCRGAVARRSGRSRVVRGADPASGGQHGLVGGDRLRHRPAEHRVARHQAAGPAPIDWSGAGCRAGSRR